MKIALSHKTPFSHTVIVSTPEQVDTLFNRALAGDTLHSVADFRDDQAEKLMQQVNQQLEKKEFQQL